MVKNLPAFLSNLSWLNCVAILIALILLMPVAALTVIALNGELESFDHLYRTVLPRASWVTIKLLVGVGLVVASIGTVTAWLVAYYNFPGRRLLEWALMLPLAVPTYISAYAFVEFLSFTGPLQSVLRKIGGFQSAQDYWFPDIRSVWGTVLVMGLVLYPYVYLSVRTLFRYQSISMIDSARILGAGRLKLLVKVAFPLARPAIILGVALALMETINDIGAVEFMGTRTLTFSIFSVWLNQNDLAGAAQIALVLLLFVVVLMIAERISRRGRRFHDLISSKTIQPAERQTLTGLAALFASVSCAMPILLGFGIPVSVLGGYAVRRLEFGLDPSLYEALFTSVLLAGSAAVLAVLLGLILVFAARAGNNPAIAAVVRAASSGYAIPGTIIALGIFLPLAMFDNFIDGLMRSSFGISTGLLITGSGATIVYAYIVRFMAMSEGTLDVGLKKISPSVDMAARSLGRSQRQAYVFVLLPIMKPILLAAGLLVFIDSLKELSATIMLRPFGVQTLSTHVYDFASRGLVEDASVGCILIIVAGIVPVIILQRSK